jgi:polysaccharide export outer membrane protein
MDRLPVAVLSLALACGSALTAGAQSSPATTRDETPVADSPATTDFVLGPDDVISVVFWRDAEMSAEVVVRPDGKISLPLLNDVQASGYTPEQLRLRLTAAAARYVETPTASVVVKQVNSRRVFIQGNIGKAGAYPLSGTMNVLQLIALAGGLAEYADSKNIAILRVEGGKTKIFSFNFKDVITRKRVEQNIDLRPGDTVVVP